MTTWDALPESTMVFSSFLCRFFSALTLILSFVPPSLTAYVQFHDCFPLLAASSHQHVSNDAQLRPDSLGAALDIGDGITHLELQITRAYADRASCEEFLAQNVSIGVTLDSLGGLDDYDRNTANMTCRRPAWAKEGSETTTLRIRALFNVSRPLPLATFQLNVGVYAADLQVACLASYLTPGIGTAAYGVCLWGPLVIFVLVLVAACWREILNLGHIQDDEGQSDAFGSSRTHLTRIANCLSYIQFIFFSGALILRYPGFLQPVVSLTSYATLMLPRGIVTQDSLYSEVNDGIHEINGTFGGTPGLELTTQVMGAPLTMSTWANIITLAIFIFFFLLAIIQVGLKVKWTRDWFQEASSWTLEDSTVERQKATLWITLRVFLSYFLQPIVTWATYQLDGIRLFPKYYTIASSLVICLVLVACWWGLSMRSPQTMGYLIIEHSQGEQNGDSAIQNQDFYTSASFTLLFARGIAIGGFQAAGNAQLLVSLVCEIVQLSLTIWAWPLTALLSTASIGNYARLAILVLNVMIPGLCRFDFRSAVGYAILASHALVLVTLFLVPSIHELKELAGAIWQARNLPISVQSHAQSGNQEEGHQEERPQVGYTPLNHVPTC